MTTRMTKSRFLEALLRVMDDKHHWAWDHFATGRLTKDQLKIHFQQEYALYVRDFPVFLARIHGKNPPPPVRRMLAENIYEEDTGGLSLGRSHPELFLSMMEGLGFSVQDFEHIRPLPASRTYRAWLDRMSNHHHWVMGAATLTIFVEGSVKDRKEMHEPSKPKSAEDIEAVIQNHPLVQHHGVPPDCMDLIRAHQLVEAGHRHDAYDMVVNYTTPTLQRSVLANLKKSLSLWLQYRDAVAKACGIKKP
ncbi:MAG TPA: iron-containing redox enzyme family protein [Nitrospiraceae bacterium]|nr:iron-containing redox enzyme family protein [Nitrospiraceae bacterium]